MRNWRVLTAVLAVVLAIIAGLLAWQYLQDADERASEDFTLVPVYRAAGEINEGTTSGEALSQELIEQFEVPDNAVPQNAISSTDQLEGLVAASTISQGQFITTDSFVTPLELRGFSQSIDEGMHAISFAVDDASAVGGFVVPNDSVNMIVTTDVLPLVTPTDPATGEPIEGADEALTTTAYLLHGVKVLAVGDTTATSTQTQTTNEDGTPVEEDEGNTGIITVEVNAVQAEQIAHAESLGQIQLVLNPPGYEDAEFQVPVEIVEVVNWFDQELTCVAELRNLLSATPEGVVGAAPACVR